MARLDDALQLERQPPRHEGQGEAQAGLIVEQVIDELVHVGQLIAANAVPHPQLAVVDVELLQDLEGPWRFEHQSQVEQSKCVEVLVLLGAQVGHHDFLRHVHLQHLEQQAQELGGLLRAAVQPADALQEHRLIDERFRVECKAFLLPVPGVEDAIPRGLVDDLCAVLSLSHSYYYKIGQHGKTSAQTLETVFESHTAHGR